MSKARLDNRREAVNTAARDVSGNDLVLVIPNVRYFQNVADLVIENWFPAEGLES